MIEDFQDAAIAEHLTDEERAMFAAEMAARRKNPTVGMVLCGLLGGVGAHRFYLGQAALGILYALFVWTLIPSFIGLIEMFMMPGRVRAHNAMAAVEIASRLKAMRPENAARVANEAQGISPGGRALAAGAAGAVVGAVAANALGGGDDAAEAVEVPEAEEGEDGLGSVLGGLLGDE